MSFDSIDFLETSRATTVTLLEKFKREARIPNKKLIMAAINKVVQIGSNEAWASTVVLAHYGIERGAELLEQTKDLIALNKLIIKSVSKFEYEETVESFTLAGNNILPFDDCKDYSDTGLITDNVEIYCRKLKDGNWVFEVNAFVKMTRLPEWVPVRVANKIVPGAELKANVNKYLECGYIVLDEDGCDIKFEDLSL